MTSSPTPTSFPYYAVSTKTNYTTGSVSAYWAADIQCPTGTDVLAVRAGTIAATGTSSSSKYSLLQTFFRGKPVTVVYKHLSAWTVTVAGTAVAEGEKIATSGNSGTGGAQVLTVACHYGWDSLDPNYHLSVGATHRPALDSDHLASSILFPTDILWSRAPVTGDGLTSAPEITDAEAYRKSLGMVTGI